MEDLTVACIQQRMSILPTHEEFEAEARRFLRQAQAKAVQLTIFPELTGVMLAPPLISGFKLGFIKREDQGKKRGAGFLSRGLGKVSGTTAGALGGGFRGSLGRLLKKNSDALRDAHFDMFGRLAREFGTAILAGSLYLYDEETQTVKNRAYLFDVDGESLGYQDKFNLAPDEHELATPGTDLAVFNIRSGRVGVLIGRDALYPELARLLAVKGAGSFLLGPNHLGRESREEFFGQSALLAPISLTPRGDGILVQVGTDRTEGLIAATLPMDELYESRQTSRFRPRQQMHLGNLGPVLAEIYQQGLSIEQAIEQRTAGPAEPFPEPVPFEAVVPVELPEEVPEAEPEASYPSVPEALSLTGEQGPEETGE
jgi:predicted amidohydrolase